MTDTREGIDVRSVVICGPSTSAPEGFGVVYTLQLDSDWCTGEVTASMLGVAKSVHLRRTSTGNWVGDNDTLLPRLDGALDVDLSITPLTNTLPIRRLGLAVAESAELTVAYVSFPELAISAGRQRYTRVAADRYRYESLDSRFVREITVDEHGLVITYPDLFHRVY